MKLPPQKKILREDLKEAPSWVNGIIEPVNSFMESVYQTLNRNVTLTENVASFVKEITYQTPASYPADVENLEFINELKIRPIGVMLLQIYDKATYLPPTSAVYVPWIFDNGSIIIHPITGLEAGKIYLVRLVVF